MGLSIPWKRDSIIIDDFVFRLHHQFNFYLIGIGALIIFAQNYLDGKAILCRAAGEDYVNRYCWHYATAYFLQRQVQQLYDEKKYQPCRITTVESAENDRTISYYVWLPFLLFVCMALSKLARLVWKEWLEGGLLKNILLRRNAENSQCGIKIAEEFRKQKYRVNMMKFFICYILCEVVNLVSVIIMMVIFDSILFGQFFSYGPDYVNYKPGLMTNNPMCEIFPTVAHCHYKAFDHHGQAMYENYICLLSNNAFNQYYFLVLWFWWVLLIVISVVKLFMRCVELGPIFKPDSTTLLKKTTVPQRFVLRFLNKNLDPDVYDQVLEELVKSKKSLPSSPEEETLVK